jgi:hypothetical protein
LRSDLVAAAMADSNLVGRLSALAVKSDTISERFNYCDAIAR